MGIVNAWRRLRIWYYQIKWLNMSRKTDKKRARHVDIILLSEIITDSMYWQGILKVCKSNFYVINTALRFIVLL
jgi:hypothetical protein